MALVYLCNPSTLQYKRMKLILTNGKIKNTISKNFLFYEMDVRVNNFFNELMYSYSDNLFLVLQRDSIISIFKPSGNPQLFLEKLKYHKKYPFSTFINSVSLLQGDSVQMAFTVNCILRLQYQLQKEIITSKYFTEKLNETIIIQPYFYNKYLLINEVRKNSDGIDYGDILDSLSFFQKRIYHKYIQSLLAYKNGIDTCLKANVHFEHLVFNFGKIKKNQKVSCVFMYKNKGKIPYLIYDIRPACGCTVARWTQKPTLAEDKDSIFVEFASNRLGFFNKEIKILSNNYQKNLSLRVKGEIIP